MHELCTCLALVTVGNAISVRFLNVSVQFCDLLCLLFAAAISACVSCLDEVYS